MKEHKTMRERVNTALKNLRDAMKEFVLSLGADLVGITPAVRLDGAPHGHRPSDILPDAKTVIVCAKMIPNSIVMQAPATSYNQTANILQHLLDVIACEIAIYVEKHGGKAIPVPSDEPYQSWDQDKLEGRGDLSHKHAAEAAGLGKLGKNSLLITPEFGNRVYLVSVVTNLDLEPDPKIEKELCPPQCALCIKACPVGAIKNGQRVDQKACRSFMPLELPKGQIVENCRECRKVCPAGTK